MALRLYKRGNIYWYEFVFNGRQIRSSTKTRNKDLARQVASVAHAGYVKGEVGLVEKKPIPRLGEAMESFLRWSKIEHQDHPNTTKRYVTSSKPLLRHFKPATSIDRITVADVEDYKLLRAKSVKLNRFGKPASNGARLRPATVNRELACLKAMFNHALKADLALRNPVEGVALLDEQNQQDRVVTFSEQDRYLAAASELLRDVATLIVEQGFRPGEVYEMRDVAVNLEDRTAKVLRGKTKAARRTLELTEESLRILERRVKRVEQQRSEAATMIPGYLFPHEDDPRRHISKVDTQHTSALEASKVPKFRVYDLRHTFATRAAESGMDPVTLASVLGHSKLQMVLRYAHPTQHHQKSAMQRTQEYVTAARAKEKARQAEREASAASKIVAMPKAV